MKLKTPSMPFEPLDIHGESITIDVDFEFVVLYTGNSRLLSKFNEFTLTEGRSLPSDGVYSFTDDYDTEFGIRCINKNIISFFNSGDSAAYFYLFSHTPSKFKIKVNSGRITQISLFPGNGIIYYGKVNHPDLIRDSNSNSIPDIIDPEFRGSIPAFLKSFSSVDGTPGIKIILLSTGDEIQTLNGKTLFVRG